MHTDAHTRAHLHANTYLQSEIFYYLPSTQIICRCFLAEVGVINTELKATENHEYIIYSQE